MGDLKDISEGINYALNNRREELKLTFFEDTHIYEMLDNDGNLRSDWGSISKKIKNYYKEFDAPEKAMQMAKGDPVKRDLLLSEWKYKADYSTNKGSFVHYELEKHAVDLYGNFKDVRKPIFECDDEQLYEGGLMINAGKQFIDLMHDRGAYLLDTEVVLGSPDIEAVGQADKFWIMHNKDKTEIGLVCTDWKTNQPKNFEVKWYTDKLYYPFNEYHNTALYHYHLQLPMYGRLLIDMLKNSEFKDIKLFGCVVVLLLSDGTFKEYKTPVFFNKTILSLNKF
jgi:hypothetical protein